MANAGTPVTGVTTFESLAPETVLAGASAASPGATAPDVAGWDFNVISPSGALAAVDVWDGSMGSGNGVGISRSDYNAADFSVVKVSANDASTFTLQSVGLNVQVVQGSTVMAGRSVTLTGLNAAGNPIAGATLTSTVNDALLVTFDVSSNASFAGISAFRLTPVTAGDRLGSVFIDNIDAINFAVIDNVAPAPPSTPVLAPGSDSGTSNSDKLTNITTPTLTGTAEAGSTVRLYDTNGTTLIGTGVATGGNWTITTGTLTPGNHTITARATDAAGNVSLPSAGLTITIDSTASNVLSVAMPAAGVYGEGESLDFTVNYSEAITVTTSGGTPHLSITLDTGGVVQAAFLFGSGTSALTFRYTVQDTNYDATGITVGSSITLNGGTLRDSAGNNAMLTLNGLGSTTGVRVDATPPTVSSINRVQLAANNLTAVSYTVAFSKPVTGVDVSDFALTTTGTLAALNLSVTPVDAMTYTVTVSSISGAGTLRLDLRSSGTGIADLAGNAIASGYTAGQVYTVDRVAPTVVGVAVPTNGTYLGTQNLTFTVTFSEIVTVITAGGTPRLPLTLDTGGNVNATYLSGSGTTAITFRYTIVSGNLDPNGITVAPALLTGGGSIRDAVGNDASLTLNGLPATTGVLVDAVVPTVTGVAIPGNATYVAGQTLDFTVTFTEPVVVNTASGTPFLGLTLETGGAVRASYVSGSGSNTLSFRYAVVSGNADTNGITIGSSITTGGGTLRDASGNNAALGLSGLPSAAGVLVDAITPSAIAINRQSPSAATTNFSTVTFRVTFNEAVNGVGSSDFTLVTSNDVVGTIVSTAAVSGSTYDVTVGSISGTGTLRLDLNALNTGITDLAGNAIGTGTVGTQSYTLDTVSPTITAVTLPAAATYKSGDPLDFRVTFSESVVTSGSPRLPLILDSGAVNATYLSGSGTSTLTFRYTVGAGALDADGIAVGAALVLNGGTVADAATNAAALALTNVPDTSGLLIDGAAPTVTSVVAPVAGTYKLGDPLDFTVQFSENVTVTGTPRLSLSLDTGGTVFAACIAGSGTNALTFRYIIAVGNADRTGVALGTSIGLNGGALRDAVGNAATLTLNNAGATSAVFVDGVVPAVTAITRIGAAVTNATSLEFLVAFSESVAGVTPAAFRLTTSGSAAGTVASVSTVSATSFRVMVNPVSGDGTLRLDFATSNTGVTDAAGNAPTSGFITGELYTLDRVAPLVTSVTVPASGTYGSGRNLDFTVRLSEAVTVTTAGGAPQLALLLDTGEVVAGYVSGSGTNALLFRYTTTAADMDFDGIEPDTTLSLNGSAIRDGAGNDLVLALNSLPSTAGVLIDGEAPTVVAISGPDDGSYRKDAVLDFTVEYSEPVNVANVVGSPSIPVTLATGGPAQAIYFAGSGTTTLTFRYLVGAGHQDADGIALGTSIALNGGAVRDSAGNAAGLTLPALATAGIRVDGLAPAIVSIARQLPAYPSTSRDEVTFRVTFNKTVTGVNAGSFGLTRTGGADGVIGTPVSTDNKVFDVSVAALTPGGTLRLDLRANSAISDAAGNVLNTAFTSGEVYTVTENFAPSFTPGADQVIGSDAGAQTVAAWATDIDPGAQGEGSQVLTFTVTVDQPALFKTPPAMAANGTLTFTPNPNASGTALVTVTLRDDADANHTSDPFTFAITLTSTANLAGTYNGVVLAAEATPISHEKSGLLRVVIGKMGAFTGNLRLGGASYPLRGNFDSSGVASFGNDRQATSLALARKGLPPLSLALQLDVSGGSDSLTATIEDEGGDFATAQADRALYTAAKNPVPPLMNVPPDLLGNYTVVFAARTPEDQERAASEFPQGDGVGILQVTANGLARLTGSLADGTPVSYGNALSKANAWPFYVAFAQGKGAVCAPVHFRDQPGISDLDAADAVWFRPANPRAVAYPDGWPDGIRLDVLGSRFVAPTAANRVKIFSGEPATADSQAAAASFTDGNLSASGLTRAISVGVRPVVTVLDASFERLSMTMIFATIVPGNGVRKMVTTVNGRFTGSFIHPISLKSTKFNGVVFQKQQTGFGYFIGMDQSGAVTLVPQ